MARQPILDAVEVTESALKHGIDEADIGHAWTNAIRLVEYEYGGEDRLLVIGPDQHGRMLVLVAVPGGEPTPDHPRRPATTQVLRLLEMR